MTVATKPLSARHLDILRAGGIDEQFALTAGAHTVNSIGDLPESMEYLFPCEGMVFEHRNPFKTDEDGNPVVVSQFRYTSDDDIPAGKKKYMQEPGTGTIPSVHPSRLSVLEDADTLVIVEGTKGSMSLSKYAPAGVAIVGILGVTGTGDSVMGVADWYSEALVGRKKVVIIPDFDVKTNHAVWHAVDKMVEYARSLGVAKVVVGVVSGSGTDSVDDALGKVSEAQRYVMAANIINLARSLKTIKPTAPRKPKELKASDAAGNKMPKVFWGDAEIRMPDQVMEVNGGTVVIQGDRLGQFAARISNIRVIRNDLDGKDADQILELDLVFKLDDAEYTIRRVSPKAMGDWRSLLDRIPGGDGVDFDVASDEKGVNQKIERAVRAYEPEDPEHATRKTNVVPRSGLIRTPAGDTAFLLHDTAVSEYGKVEGLEGDLSSSGINHLLQTTDLETLSQEDIQTAVKEMVNSVDLVHDKTSMWALLGAMYFTPSGLIPQTGLGLVGLPGSGKSTIMQFAFSGYGRPLMDAPMFSFDDSENSIGAGTGIGWHNLAVVCDDLRPEQDARVRAAKWAAFDLLMRRSYGGGQAGKGRQKWSADKGVTNDAPDQANMMAVVGAEPGGFPDASSKYSTHERMLVISVETETSLVNGGESVMRDLVRRNVPAITFNAYLRWLCEQVDSKGGLAAWNEHAEGIRDKRADKMKKNGVAGTHRSIRVASTFSMGIRWMLQFANDIGAITDEEAAERLKDADSVLMAAAIEHFDTRLAGARSGFENAVEQIRMAISNQDAWIIDPSSGMDEIFNRAKLIGRRVKDFTHPKTGETFEAIVLNPDSVARLLKVSKEHAIGKLKEKAVPNSQGRFGWERNAGAGTIKTALVIRSSDFDAKGN